MTPKLTPHVHPSDSGAAATEWERLALKMDGLWSEDSYPEFGQEHVLAAYRLGHEDGASDAS